MSDEPTLGLTPRDHENEASRRTSRRRRWLAIAAGVGVVAAIGVAELTGGVVSRVIDATGWTCGGSWNRIDDDDLAEQRVIRWGTPEARDQGFDPEDFLDLPPGLAEPSLTTERDPAEGEYNPFLYPLGEDVVLQGSGYFDRAWVAADAGTGEPLWGVEDDSSGFSTIRGRFTLLAGREDGRTDLTTFAPRTGEQLSCVRLPGEVIDMVGVGEHDLVVGLRVDGGDDDDGSDYQLVRVDPVGGSIVWERPLNIAPQWMYAEGDLVVASPVHPEGAMTQWPAVPPSEAAIVALDAASGNEAWSREPGTGQAAVMGAVPLPDGGAGTVVLEIADRQSWDARVGEYVLLDQSGVEMWRTPASYEQQSVGVWGAEQVVVVLEGYQPIGLDIRTGERLWQAEGGGSNDDIALLTAGGTASLVFADQRLETEDGETAFVTHVIDVRTGATTVYDVPLRSFEMADGYVLSSTAGTQIVIPLE